MTVTETQAEIVDEFAFFEDWADKYKYIIDLGKDLEAFPEAQRTDENKVRGCQSQVWLHAEAQEGKVKFWGDSDAMIVKGLVALLLRVFSGHTPQEILESDTKFLEEIGLGTHLSPTRTNGLFSMVKQIRMYALAFQAKSQA